jgi:MoxR-like ATPase
VTAFDFRGPSDVADRLEAAGYLPGKGLAAAVFLAARLGRPLFLEGDPGVGKTSMAEALSEILEVRLIRLQCHGGIDASQALYDWDFPRQILQLRAIEGTAIRSLYTQEFLIERPILQAVKAGSAVLLIDEIDRADDEFEAFLLEALENNTVTIPELGPQGDATNRPMVILTSNRTREVHDALKRRCYYHWIEHPGYEREVQILRRQVAGLSAGAADRIAAAMQSLRTLDLLKTPGIAESIDLARAMIELGGSTLTEEVVDAALGTVAKHHKDRPVVRDALLSPDHRVG